MTAHHNAVFRLIAGFVLISLGRTSIAETPRSAWKAGTAGVVITPDKPVWLAGYGHRRVPQGKVHDLRLKALALEDSRGQRAVLLTSDNQGMPKAMYESIIRKIHDRFGLDRPQVMLTFSHNHCGPRLRDDLVDYYPVEQEQVALVDEYTKLVENMTADAVGRALTALAPASLSAGEGAATFAVNRRNNLEAKVPEILASGTPLKGPVDHSVPVLAVHDEAGRLKAVVFAYACHPTTLGFTQWCGDYPGFAQIALEKAHPGTTAMFFTGCGGDQDPWPRGRVELCEQYGQQLADAVEKVLGGRMKPVSSGLQASFESVELPYLKTATREELTEARLSKNAILARWAARMLKKLDDGERFGSSYPYPVQVWRFDDGPLLIALGGEAVVDYSLRFKKEFGPNTWVCGYANNLVAYIPSHRVWEEGGYEGGDFLFEYGHPARRWTGDVEDRITAAVRRLVRKLNSTSMPE